MTNINEKRTKYRSRKNICTPLTYCIQGNQNGNLPLGKNLTKNDTQIKADHYEIVYAA